MTLNSRLLTTDLSNFDKRWSDAHFVSFWYYYYCTQKLLTKIKYFFSQKYMFSVLFIYCKMRKNRLVRVKFLKPEPITTWTKFYPILTWFNAFIYLESSYLKCFENLFRILVLPSFVPCFTTPRKYSWFVVKHDQSCSKGGVWFPIQYSRYVQYI